jgi:hypothetical protein
MSYYHADLFLILKEHLLTAQANNVMIMSEANEGW